MPNKILVLVAQPSWLGHGTAHIFLGPKVVKPPAGWTITVVAETVLDGGRLGRPHRTGVTVSGSVALLSPLLDPAAAAATLGVVSLAHFGWLCCGGRALKVCL